MVAEILESETFTLLPPQLLFSMNRRYAIDDTATWTSYDVLPDGRFVMVSTPDSDSRQRIAYVENWFEELAVLESAP